VGKFSKIKKYSKPSLTVDEKLDILNRELIKTGMLSEKMTTSTVYPDTETQPYIPPTYDLVPDSSGITGNSFSQPVNGGDENDSDTWADGWNSNEYLTNADELDGVTNRSIVSHVPNSPYDDGGGGMVITGRYFGRSIGYLSGGNVYKQVLSGGLTGGTNAPTEDSRGLGGYYAGLTDDQFDYAVAFNALYQSLVNEYGYNSIPTVNVKAWVAYNRFHDYQRGGEFDEWTGGPKKTTDDGDFILDTFAVVKVRSTDKYMSDPGQPRTAVLNRMDDIDSPHYHPGFIERALFGALDVGRRGLEYLRGKATSTIDNINTTAEKISRFAGGVDKKINKFMESRFNIKDVLPAFAAGQVGMLANSLTAPANDGGSHSLQLAANLILSVITGSSKEIKISERGKKDMIGGVNMRGFEKALEIGIPPKPDGSNAIRPGNKRDDVLSGAWSAPGGVEVHYNPQNKKLTITSNKMLRSGQDGDEFETQMGLRDSINRQTKFGDIPVPTKDEVIRTVSEYVMDGFSGKLGAPDVSKANEIERQSTLNAFQNFYQEHPVSSTVIGTITNFVDSVVNAGVSDVVELRRQLVDSGLLPPSEAEKQNAGFGGNVFSQTTYDYNEIPDNLKQIINKKTSVKESVNLTEGWQSPKHTYIEPNERKRWFNPNDIAPEYPTKPPNDGIFYGSSEEPPVTKKKEPHIKITEKDLIKNHRLKDSEVKEMMDTINALNAFLDAHPEELIHAQKRYPKNDPRLAELNWKMDQMLSASEEYMDTHFPENTRLFNRVQKSINRSIKLTDPRTYKDSKLPDTYYKLLSVDYVSGYGVEKKILKLGSKNKKSPARFLKKPRLKTKAQVLEDKLMQLETDLKKTGMGA